MAAVHFQLNCRILSMSIQKLHRKLPGKLFPFWLKMKCSKQSLRNKYDWTGLGNFNFYVEDPYSLSSTDNPIITQLCLMRTYHNFIITHFACVNGLSKEWNNLYYKLNKYSVLLYGGQYAANSVFWLAVRFVPGNKISPKFKWVHESFLSIKLLSAISLSLWNQKKRQRKRNKNVDKFYNTFCSKKWQIKHKSLFWIWKFEFEM